MPRRRRCCCASWAATARWRRRSSATSSRTCCWRSSCPSRIARPSSCAARSSTTSWAPASTRVARHGRSSGPAWRARRTAASPRAVLWSGSRSAGVQGTGRASTSCGAFSTSAPGCSRRLSCRSAASSRTRGPTASARPPRGWSQRLRRPAPARRGRSRPRAGRRSACAPWSPWSSRSRAAACGTRACWRSSCCTRLRGRPTAVRTSWRCTSRAR
mmetsp:Transcript_115301/g.312998  ORF Transcript_115301/g.312998 Transcript_115301/m.312998 type:complete len:215 (+) Transcript_115301:270-914(+)